MKTHHRSHRIALATMSVLVLTIGCEPSPIVPGGGDPPPPLELNSTTVGAIHNLAMDHVLADLEVARAQGALNAASSAGLVRASLTTFFEERQRAIVTDELWALGVEAAADPLGRLERALVEHTPAPPVESALRGIVASSMGGASLVGFRSNLEAIGRTASGLSREEADVVRSTISVAEASAAYWAANYDAWRTLLCDAGLCNASVQSMPSLVIDGAPDGPRFSTRGWQVLAGDVVGCGGGILFGGMYGCAVGAASGSIMAMF